MQKLGIVILVISVLVIINIENTLNEIIMFNIILDHFILTAYPHWDMCPRIPRTAYPSVVWIKWFRIISHKDPT